MGLAQALPAGLPLPPIVCAGSCKPLAAVPRAQRSIPQLLSVKCCPVRPLRQALAIPIAVRTCAPSQIRTCSKERAFSDLQLHAGFAGRSPGCSDRRAVASRSDSAPQVSSNGLPGATNVCPRSPGLPQRPGRLRPAMASAPEPSQHPAWPSCDSPPHPPPPAAGSDGGRHAAEPAVHQGCSGPGAHLAGESMAHRAERCCTRSRLPHPPMSMPLLRPPVRPRGCSPRSPVLVAAGRL